MIIAVSPARGELGEHDPNPSPDDGVEAGEALLGEIEVLGREDGAGARTRGPRDLGPAAQVVDETLVTLLSGGHALLIGVPGLAKTRLVETLAVVLGLIRKARPVHTRSDARRHPGLRGLGGIRGPASATFRFISGPVFCQLLMADEINRASPRTQSALLQAMQEHEVSVAGQRHPLPSPFHVLATQNPLEQEGTYPLPEAQLDRFLIQIDVGYPDAEAERRMVLATTGVDEEEPGRGDELPRS